MSPWEWDKLMDYLKLNNKEKQMRLIMVIVLTIILCCFSIAQKKDIIKTDSIVTQSSQIEKFTNEIRGIQSQMRGRDWYTEFIAYQQRLAYLQGRTDGLLSIKDSLITMDKKELK
jgi:hypothetical protein